MTSAASTRAPSVAQRLLAQTQSCVRCGLCQPHCPTYALDRSETESPRGRITLAAALATDQLEDAFESAAVALDHCLACRRCERACPAGVPFDALMVDARTLLRSRAPPPWKQRLLEWAIARRWPLRVGWPVLRVLRPLLPAGWRRALPPVPAAGPGAGLHAASGTRRGRIALFTGCVAERLDADVHRAAIRVLNQLGWEVWLPAGPLCCGALQRHAGAPEAGEHEQRATLATLRQQAGDCSAVLVAASGCFADLCSALADGGPPVHELSSFIADDARLPTLVVRASQRRVALHTPCTQSTAVGRADAPARLLAAIPGLQIDRLADRGCCGAAGSHALLHPDRAAALRADVLDSLGTHGADTLCSGNIGCRLHLAAGVTELGLPQTVRHPIELLAGQLE